MNSPLAPSLSGLFAFDNTYARDLQGFYAPWQPTAVSTPHLLILNEALAQELGLDAAWFRTPEGLAILAGNTVPAGAAPLAQAYAGHQFGHFSPQLGDGRALLLGEVLDRHGQRRDIALKGSGRTPFSRRGDGKCALGPALREYLVGQAMAVLGIPTTQTLAVVASGDTVQRDRPLPGAVLTRVAASHLRIGTFEFFAAHRGAEAVRQLADYAIARHYPEIQGRESPYVAFLEGVARRQADLVARWLGVGFIHGVMNTDNMSISGETIDYGPCAFMEAYHPNAVFSSIDTEGRYAYGRQGGIARWNLTRLAEALLPLLDADEDRAVEAANRILESFPGWLEERWLAVFRAKLGLDPLGDFDDDRMLVRDFLDLLKVARCDFTLGFRALCDEVRGQSGALEARVGSAAVVEAWKQRWQRRRRGQGGISLAAMHRANPCYIPRNQRVEEVLEAAVERGDLEPFRRLEGVLAQPWEERCGDESYAQPAPAAFNSAYQTFCGT